jgi:hypothetical protein
MHMDVADLTNSPPLSARALKFGCARLFITTIGRLPKGIAIGCNDERACPP